MLRFVLEGLVYCKEEIEEEVGLDESD